jgi:hypothetical protein
MSWAARYIHLRFRPEQKEVFQLVFYNISDEAKVKHSIMKSGNNISGSNLFRKSPKRNDLLGHKPAHSHTLHSIEVSDITHRPDGLPSAVAHSCLFLDIDLPKNTAQPSSTSPSMLSRAKNTILSPTSKIKRLIKGNHVDDDREHLILRFPDLEVCKLWKKRLHQLQELEYLNNF